MTPSHLAPVDTSTEWGHLPPDVREEIDIFETELRRVQAGLIDEKLFTEFRLRHGVYGQRQDRGPDAADQDPHGPLQCGPVQGFG